MSEDEDDGDTDDELVRCCGWGTGGIWDKRKVILRTHSLHFASHGIE
jgi:hypothetical protein